MDENIHHIDDLFRKGLADGEDTPPQRVWAQIEDALDKGAKPSAPAALRWLKPFAVVASLVLVGTAVYLLRSGSPVQQSAGDSTMQVPELTDSASLSTPINGDKAYVAPQRGIVSAASAGSKEREPTEKTSGSSDAGKEVADKPLVRREGPAAAIEGKTGEPPVATRISIAVSNEVKSKTGVVNSRSTPDLPDITQVQTQENGGTEIPGQSGRSTSVDAAQSGDKASSARAYQPVLAQLPARSSFNSSLVLEGAGQVRPLNASLGQRTGSPVQAGKEAAQSTAPPVQRTTPLLPKFSITPVAAISMTSNQIKANPNYGPRGGRDRHDFKQTEQNKVTVSPGLLADFRMGKRFSLQTGIAEYRHTIDIGPKKISAVRDSGGPVRYRLDCSVGTYYIDPKAGTPPPAAGDSIRLSASTVNLQYASIPLTVKYNGGTHAFRYYVLAGLEYNFLLNQDVSATLQQSPGEKFTPVRSEGLKSSYVKGVLGGGMDIMLTRNLAFTLMPQYRFALKSSNHDGPVNTFPNSFTIMTGLKISL